MTKIEKAILWGIVASFVAMIGSCAVFLHTVDKAGGVKAVVIQAGKEIKDIGKEISKP